ncbi:MAG: hypothetical protein M3128_10600 [Verrucomicrobiota bacterium]|nr:hypothetical protein [Verrucomicrobiota bacterium]
MYNKLSMSFREKSAWITLLLLLAVYGPYFIHISHLAQNGELSLPALVKIFISALFLQIIVAVIAHVAISIGRRVEAKDERDRAIEAKAFRNGYFVFISAISCAAIGILMLSPFPEPAANSGWLSGAGISQILLLCMVLAEITKYGTHVVCYRRGA